MNESATKISCATYAAKHTQPTSDSFLENDLESEWLTCLFMEAFLDNGEGTNA
jgi:hypothetical protein